MLHRFTRTSCVHKSLMDKGTNYYTIIGIMCVYPIHASHGRKGIIKNGDTIILEHGFTM